MILIETAVDCNREEIEEIVKRKIWQRVDKAKQKVREMKMVQHITNDR